MKPVYDRIQGRELKAVSQAWVTDQWKALVIRHPETDSRCRLESGPAARSTLVPAPPGWVTHYS